MDTKPKSYPFTVLVIGVLCIRGIASFVITAWAVITGTTALPATAKRMLFAELLTFPWAYVLALGLAVWLQTGASRATKACAWTVIGAASLGHLMLLAR